jgi:hypothetical protein
MFKINKKIILTVLAGVFALIAFACQNSTADNAAKNQAPANSSTARTNGAATLPEDKKPPTMTDYPVGNAQTPSEAYRMLFAAVKSQDTAKIKSMMSKMTVNFIEGQAARSNQPVEKVYQNGLTETTFANEIPQLRDERVKGNYGAVEVWSEKSRKWEDIPFVKEDGSWKAAFGDIFAGSYQSPGKGQAQLEQEAANAANPNQPPTKPMADANASVNSNVQKKVPKPR